MIKVLIDGSEDKLLYNEIEMIVYNGVIGNINKFIEPLKDRIKNENGSIVVYYDSSTKSAKLKVNGCSPVLNQLIEEASKKF